MPSTPIQVTVSPSALYGVFFTLSLDGITVAPMGVRTIEPKGRTIHEQRISRLYFAAFGEGLPPEGILIAELDTVYELDGHSGPIMQPPQPGTVQLSARIVDSHAPGWQLLGLPKRYRTVSETAGDPWVMRDGLRTEGVFPDAVFPFVPPRTDGDPLCNIGEPSPPARPRKRHRDGCAGGGGPCTCPEAS